MNARRLAESTKTAYTNEFKAYQRFFRGEDLRYISRDDIIRYISYLYDLGYSGSKVNQAINAIKFWKEKCLGQKRETYFIKRPWREKFVPLIISYDKMISLIDNTRNLKHRAILHTIYHNGLRISELLNLTLMDVRTRCDNPQLIIRNSKHNRTRIIMLTPDNVELLQLYYRKYKPKNWLFEGEKGNCRYSKTSVARILQKACKRENIKERFRVHDLRHNFATHSLQLGTNIHHLARHLGHASVKTTESTYSHLLPEQISIVRPQLRGHKKVIHITRAI